MQRHLAFDYPQDTNVHNIWDQFMWGNSILVAPATMPQQRQRSVYFPDDLFISFWTGASFRKTTASVNTPYNQIPFFVKAGSVLLLGPYLQYSQEKPFDPIEVRVYPGASSEVSAQLYEDDGHSHAFEQRNQYSLITFTWDDTQSTLTISDRVGSFPSMLASRIFNIVKVGPNKAVGLAPWSLPDASVTYLGTKMTVRLP